MKKLIIVSALLCPLNIFGITFEEALRSAYTNSESFQLIRNDFLKELEDFPQALSNFMPKVTGHIGAFDRKHKPREEFRNYTRNGEYVPYRSEESYRNIKIIQPIFSGGSGVSAMKAAQSSFRSARATYYLNEQKTILNALKVYLQYYAAKEKYEISITSLENTKKQLKAAEEKLKIGEMTQSDYAGAIAGMASAETTKLAKFADFQTAKANFIKMFGIEPTNIDLPAIPMPIPSTLEELLIKVRANNFDIEVLKHSISTSLANEGVVKGKLLPQVNLSVEGGHNSRRNERGLHDHNARGKYLDTGISVDIPIYSQGGAEYSNVRKAKNQTRRTVILTESKIKEIETECVKSWESFNANKSSIIAATEGEKAQQIAYDSIVQEEQVGSKTMLDVLLILDRLNKSKLDKIDVLVQYIMSGYELKALLSELTAKSLNLCTTYFNPEAEFKKSKIKIIGF